MATITNIPYASKSMNGIITISDGEATMENGDIDANNITTDNISSNTHTIDGDLTVNGNTFLGNSALDIHTVKGKMTFNDTLPECGLAPTTANQLINKNYVDTNFLYKTGSITENITGIKTFSLPPEHSSTITTNNQMTNKLYVDTKFNSIDLSNYVTKNGADTISGLKTFTTLPESSVSATTNNQLTNKTYVDTKFNSIDLSNYVTKNGADTISGLKTFSTLPESSISATTNNQLTNKTYVDTKFNSIDLSNYVTLNTSQNITANKRFSNISVGKANTTYVLDVSGNANFDTPTNSITVVNPNFTSFTGFTAPSGNTPVTIQTNLTGTYTNNGWSWNGAGTNRILWMNNGNNGTFYAGPPPGYSYQLGHYTYSGNAFYTQQNFTNLTPGNYILTFWSMWGGGSNGGSLTAKLTISMGNSNDTYTYVDPSTRALLTWVQRTARFTVNTSGASYIRWTPSDTAVNGTLFAWAIAGITLTYYSALNFKDSVRSSLIGSSSSVLYNAYITNLYAFNTLSLTGIPSFYAAGNNTSCLVLNSTFSTKAGAANSYCVIVGDAVSPNGTNMSQCTHIGYAIQVNAANPVTSSTKSTIIGQKIEALNNNKDIIIGTYIKKSSDTTGENICIGYNIGCNQVEALNGVGCGRRSIAIGSSIFNDYPSTGYTTSLPLESIAIGYYSQLQSSDNYNTSIGCYSLQQIYGNNNQYTSFPRTTQYNTAIGHQAGKVQYLLNKCTFVGALSDSNTNDISNATALGYGATVGANYATSIGSDVTNTTANSVKIGRSTDTVYIDGDLTISNGISATSTQTINFGTNAPTMSGANISSSSVPDGSLSSNVVFKNTANTFTNTQTFTTINTNYISPQYGNNPSFSSGMIGYVQTINASSDANGTNASIILYDGFPSLSLSPGVYSFNYTIFISLNLTSNIRFMPYLSTSSSTANAVNTLTRGTLYIASTNSIFPFCGNDIVYLTSTNNTFKFLIDFNLLPNYRDYYIYKTDLSQNSFLRITRIA